MNDEIYNNVSKEQLVETIKKFKNSYSKLIKLNKEKDKKIGELSALLAVVHYKTLKKDNKNYKEREI